MLKCVGDYTLVFYYYLFFFCITKIGEINDTTKLFPLKDVNQSLIFH
uniref:Uncharacterized protein n=1 Tax=Myoviridae sp. ctPuP5 TaxID=2823543 RepID=A0A8S5L9N6_9CAUD|nr:MAG TPA: hypothetical protein [Myoviridae sp. ctPuP5]